MKKYNIEGSIDFFSELYKSLDDEDENLCLITNLPLSEKYVTMDCGHKFNYIPLYFDIKNHKQKFNGMEGSSSRLNKNEIRCPYCRNRHKGVLPYYEDLGLAKIDGVNFVDPNYKSHVNTSSCYKHCQFLTPNPNFNPLGENASETNASNNNNCKYFLCFHMGSKINFQYGQETGENYGDDKYYCWNDSQ
jgi:DNA-directed RNA polymerase subunit RPC12/RpoP